MAYSGVSSDDAVKQLKEARWLFDLVSTAWPSTEDVIWMQPEEITAENVPVLTSANTLEQVLEESIGAIFSQTACLGKVLSRVLGTHHKEFNVFDSAPELLSLTTNVKWPGQLHGIRNKWISPSTSSKEAVLSLVPKFRDEMWRNETLIVQGFPLSNLFCIEFLFLIAHLFDKVGLVRPHGSSTTIIFFQFQRLTRPFESILQSISFCLESKDTTEISIYFIPNFKKNLNKFLKISSIIEYLSLKNQMSVVLSKIEKAINTADFNSRQDEISLQDFHDDQGSPECAKVRLNDSKTKHLVSCQKLRNKLELYLCYSSSFSLDCLEQSIWFDFSGACFSDFELLSYATRIPSSTMEVTKFCVGQLLECQQDLCEILKKCLKVTEEEIWTSSCLSSSKIDTVATKVVNYPWSSSPLEVLVLDFGKELWMNMKKHKANRDETLKRIIKALGELWKNECLELRGFPVLNDFNVSLIFLLCHLFDKVRLYHTHSGCNTITFIRLKNDPRKVEEVRQHLEAAIMARNTVRSLVPLKCIFGAQFFKGIMNANNASLKKQCIFMCKMLLNKNVSIDTSPTPSMSSEADVVSGT